MAVKIRLTRMGSKKKPVYRIVASDSRRPRDGQYIAILTDTARSIFSKAGIMAEFAKQKKGE